jgi:hypothetical protein
VRPVVHPQQQYIRNNNPKLRTLTVYPDAPLKVYGDQSELISVDLKRFASTLDRGGLFSFYVDGARILEAHEVGLP